MCSLPPAHATIVSVVMLMAAERPRGVYCLAAQHAARQAQEGQAQRHHRCVPGALRFVSVVVGCPSLLWCAFFIPKGYTYIRFSVPVSPDLSLLLLPLRWCICFIPTLKRSRADVVSALSSPLLSLALPTLPSRRPCAHRAGPHGDHDTQAAAHRRYGKHADL